MHVYLLSLIEKDEDRDRVNRTLVGPPRIVRPSVRDERTGIVPPAWWRGDEYASRTSAAAAMTLRRRV